MILLGDRELYSLLSAADPDFLGLFKVAVDFEDDVRRDRDNDLAYAREIAAAVAREGMRALDRAAVARTLDHVARLAGDSEKLSAHMGNLLNLVREADYWAGERGNGLVTAADVERAITAQEQRSGRVRERVLEEIQRGTFLIDTSGAKVG